MPPKPKVIKVPKVPNAPKPKRSKVKTHCSIAEWYRTSFANIPPEVCAPIAAKEFDVAGLSDSFCPFTNRVAVAIDQAFSPVTWN